MRRFLGRTDEESTRREFSVLLGAPLPLRPITHFPHAQARVTMNMYVALSL